MERIYTLNTFLYKYDKQYDIRIGSIENKIIYTVWGQQSLLLKTALVKKTKSFQFLLGFVSRIVINSTAVVLNSMVADSLRCMLGV